MRRVHPTLEAELTVCENGQRPTPDTVHLPSTAAVDPKAPLMTLNEDDEAIAGDWDYSGSGTVRYFVVKAGPQYAVYEYTTAITGGSTNLGLWDTSELGNKGVSHVTAYSYVPEPTTALMLGLGLIGLGWMGRVSG